MNNRTESARRQRAANAERFGELLNAGHCPTFADELVAIWREFHEAYQRYQIARSGLAAFAAELSLRGDPRFRFTKLPGGEKVPLYLAEASSEDEVRRNPSLVLGLPRSPRRREKGKASQC